MTITDAERRRAYSDAITFEEFVAGTVNFTGEFRTNYAATALDERDRALLADISTPIDVLAIVEDWCPDVAANLPVVARIADDTGVLRLHVLVRDAAHRDIADAYPYEGRSHIPTYVFFAGDQQLGVIVERPAPIRAITTQFLDRFFTDHPELDPATFPAGLTDELRSELIGRGLTLRHEFRDLERASLIEEIHALAVAARSEPAGV